MPALSQDPRAGGVLVPRAQGGRKRGVPAPNIPFAGISPYTALLSPHPARAGRALLPRLGAGAVVAISPEWPARGGEPDSALHRHHPIHRTVGISPGVGLGEGTPSPAKRTILALRRAPAQERVFSWKEPGWGAAGGRRPIHRSPISSTPPAPSALLPRPTGRGQ